MVVPSSCRIKPSEKVEHTVYQVPYKSEFFEYDLARLEMEGNKFQLLRKVSEAQVTMCESFLQNTEFQEKLKGVDIIVYDSVAGCPAVMLGERYDIPRVEILPLPLNLLQRLRLATWYQCLSLMFHNFLQDLPIK